MWDDPIVNEVRKAGAELSDESGGNIQIFFSRLKAEQEKYADRLAVKIPLKTKTVQHKGNATNPDIGEYVSTA